MKVQRIANKILFLVGIGVYSVSSATTLAEQRRHAWRVLDQILSESNKLIPAQDLTTSYIESYPQFSDEEKFGQTPVPWNKLLFLSEGPSFERWSSPFRTMYSQDAAKHILAKFYPLTECLKDISKKMDHRVTCLGAEFPLNSYIVKFQWQRLDGQKGIRVPHTRNEDLEELYKHSYEWKNFSISSIPTELIIRVGPTENYALVGVHVMDKSSRDWNWISAWWSPEDSSNFAEDRPVALSSSWLKKAKICVTDSHQGKSDDSLAGFPSLAAGLAITHAFNQGYSWCSNPYIEQGVGNARTNCLGCHQYAGPLINPFDLLKASLVDPLLILKQDNAVVPLDYSWSIIQGEHAVGLEILDWRNYFETQWTNKKPIPKRN